MSQGRPIPRSVSDMDRQIGARIRAQRLETGMSQERLAEQIGVTFQQIQKYEKGVNRVSASTLHHIAQALDITIPALFGPTAGHAGSDSLQIDDPYHAEFGAVAMRLNKAGRDLLLALARNIASQPLLQKTVLDGQARPAAQRSPKRPA